MKFVVVCFLSLTFLLSKCNEKKDSISDVVGYGVDGVKVYNHFDSKQSVEMEGKLSIEGLPSTKILIRVDQGERLWLRSSAFGVEVARLLVEPDSVFYVNRLEKKAFKGDFQDLKNFSEIDVDFEILQSLILDQKQWDFADLEERLMKDSIHIEQWTYGDFRLAYLSNGQLQNWSQTLVSNIGSEKNIEINYLEYKNYDGNLNFPYIRHYIIKNHNTKIADFELEIDKIERNGKLTFPLKYLLTICLISWLGGLVAQDIHQLEKEKSQLDQEIAKTNSLLKETGAKEKDAFKAWQSIAAKIQLRKKVIQNLDNEVAIMDRKIGQTNKEISVLNGKVEMVQKEISTMLKKEQLFQLTNDKSLLLLSATHFNQLLLRWRYLNQISNHRKEMFVEFKALKEELNARIESLEEQKAKQLKVMALRKDQLKELEADATKSDALVAELRKDKNALSKKLASQESKRIALNTKISELIAASRKTVGVTEADYALSGKFENNKGKLPWPVAGGQLERGFGSQAHPLEKRISIKSDGIDLHLDGSQDVKCIYEGKVIAALQIPGYKNVVMVKHGEYTSIYSKLDVAHVKEGDHVTLGQKLGRVEKSDDGADVHFEIWKNTTPQNPMSWLRK